MNKLDKQIETIQRKTILMFNMGIDIKTLLKASNTKIKQSILKAIMERKPKENEDYIGHIGNDTHKAYDSGKKNGYNYGLDKFESVIKEVLK